MALALNSDYVYAPTVDLVMDKACLVATKSFAYVVMDKVPVDRGFLVEVLSDHHVVESLSVDGDSVRNHLGQLLAHPDTTQEMLHAFFEGLKHKWPDGTYLHDLRKAKKIKAAKGLWCMPGSMLVKFEGNMGFTMVATGIPAPYKLRVAEFYAD